VTGSDEISLKELMNVHLQGISTQLQGIQRQIEDFKMQADYRDRERNEAFKQLDARVDALERRQWTQSGVVAVILLVSPFIFWFLNTRFG
jgi:hypothetical protein